MKYLINLLLLAGIVGLTYLLITGIREPIAFQAEKNARKTAVADRLSQIRTSQEMFRSIKGNFATNFDELITTLKTDSIPFIQVFEDPDDPTNEDKYVYKTIYSNALDSIGQLGINLDEMKYVPYTDKNVQFDFFGDTLTYQKTLVSVTEVGTRWKNFMGEFADQRFTKYDKSYNPDAMIKFGDRNTPNVSGNWE